jgi:hypothetical protein
VVLVIDYRWDIWSVMPGGDMDSTLIAAASTGGTALVTAMVTDGWGVMREGVLDLWRRFRPASASELEGDLDSTRTALVAAPAAEVRQVRAAMESAWQGRLLTLFLEDRSAADEFQELISWLSETGAVKHERSFRAEARDHGRVYQAGGNQYINER